MFSTGQLVFASLFLVAFSIVIFLTYKKDKDLHKRNFKGVKWIGIFFVIFLVILFIIKYVLKN